MICAACLNREGEPDTTHGGCVHYWHHRCDELTIALDDLAGEVNDSGLPTEPYMPLFESWLRASSTLRGGS